MFLLYISSDLLVGLARLAGFARLAATLLLRATGSGLVKHKSKLALAGSVAGFHEALLLLGGSVLLPRDDSAVLVLHEVVLL
jgi:hypothetical protein